MFLFCKDDIKEKQCFCLLWFTEDKEVISAKTHSKIWAKTSKRRSIARSEETPGVTPPLQRSWSWQTQTSPTPGNMEQAILRGSATALGRQDFKVFPPKDFLTQ